MDLQLDPEQLQLRDATRRVLGQRLATLVERLPDPPVHDASQALRDAQTLGWLGLGLPEKVGGAGGFSDLTVVHEELGRGLAPSLVTTLGLAARLLLHCDPLPARLLERLCAGALLLAPAVGDPFIPGTAVRATQTPAGMRLDGYQPRVVDGQSVTHLLVTVATQDRVQLVLVPTGAPGLTLHDHDSPTDVAQCSSAFDGVLVAADAVLSRDARAALQALRVEATTLAAARALGGGRAVLERTLEHVRTRHQFDRAIGTFQAVQHQLADVATALDAAGLAVARAAWSVESGADQEETGRAAAVAGLAAHESFATATLVAHQLHGGMGFVLDSPLHLWSARAVGDPTLALGRRHLLDALATANGITAEAVRVPPDHRAALRQ